MSYPGHAPIPALVLIAALAAPTALWSQAGATPDNGSDTTAGTPTAAVSAADCAAGFARLDADGNGFVSQTEAPRETARASIDGIVPGDDGLTEDEFTRICTSAVWSQQTPEAGAPFEGANSFTEEQARERAIAWNVTAVSALALDDQGIWRGTGTVGGNAVSVAIDFKGNVVTTPAAQ